jgi:hypothetical protein
VVTNKRPTLVIWVSGDIVKAVSDFYLKIALCHFVVSLALVGQNDLGRYH